MYHICSDTKVRIQDYFPAGIHLVNALSHSCQNDNRKFQPLTFMNTHHTHQIFIFTKHGSFRKIHLVFFKALNIAQKLKQSAVTGLFKCRRLCIKHIQICLPLSTCRHCSGIVVISRIIHQLPQNITDRITLCLFPETVELF